MNVPDVAIENTHEAEVCQSFGPAMPGWFV